VLLAAEARTGPARARPATGGNPNWRCGRKDVNKRAITRFGLGSVGGDGQASD